ncbi:AmmeMemoRadiSam system radical SAM enzyme [Candidatus Margulisiibacteriota bacterium]
MKTRFWQVQKDNKVQCLLCPRKCILAEGKRGFCFVRQNISGQLVSATYGKTSGFSIDPIEKKPLNHFYPGTDVFSFGTVGCNLGCLFCQNWHISTVKTADRLQSLARPAEIARAAKEQGCLSVAFTYNEPTIFVEYAIDTAIECHKLGLKTVAVTNGYINPEPGKEFFTHLDAANIDLKSFSEEFYKKYCQAHLQPVLDTVLYVAKETDVWLELTTLLIPDANDSDKELHELTEWIAENLGLDVPLHFSAFHPAFKLIDREPTPLSTLQRARRIAFSKGIRYVYTSNLFDIEGTSTWCPNCKEMVIERSYYVSQNKLREGKCSSCGHKIAGRF